VQEKHTTFAAKNNYFIPLQNQQEDMEIQTGYVVAEQTITEGQSKERQKLMLIVNQYLTI
jgi:protein involved in ribonucleotide reduction